MRLPNWTLGSCSTVTSVIPSNREIKITDPTIKNVSTSLLNAFRLKTIQLRSNCAQSCVQKVGFLTEPGRAYGTGARYPSRAVSSRLLKWSTQCWYRKARQTLASSKALSALLPESPLDPKVTVSTDSELGALSGSKRPELMSINQSATLSPGGRV
jgi:hypothetical protein